MNQDPMPIIILHRSKGNMKTLHALRRTEKKETKVVGKYKGYNYKDGQ